MFTEPIYVLIYNIIIAITYNIYDESIYVLMYNNVYKIMYNVLHNVWLTIFVFVYFSSKEITVFDAYLITLDSLIQINSVQIWIASNFLHILVTIYKILLK